jgi:hypothetical protein
MISALQLFSAVGLLSGVFSLGTVLLLASDRSRLAAIPLVARLSIAVTAGLALWSIPLLVAAMSGVYRAAWFGAAGWLVALASARFINCEIRRTAVIGPRMATSDYLLLAGLLVAAVLYLGFPTESPIILGDAGVYANHAVHIERTGRLDIPYKFMTDAVDAVIDTFWYEPEYGKMYAPGFYLTAPTITVQFAHLLPVWLAQVYASFGPAGLFRFNALLALLAIGVFYGVADRLMSRKAAVGAALVFALNPGQIWMARTTLTEIFTQLFLWGGLLLLLHAFENRATRLAGLAGLLLGFTGLLRIDSFLLVPLFISAHFVIKIALPDKADEDEPVWRSFYQVMIPIFALAYCYYVFYSQPYFYALSSLTTKIGGVTILSLGLHLFARGRSAETLGRLLRSRSFFILCCVILGSLSVYCYFIRPHLDSPYIADSIFGKWNNSIGLRDFREDSLVNLSRYLSPPVVWGGVAGFLLLFKRVLSNRLNSFAMVLLAVVGGYSILYLWAPSINPHHIYAIRRFIPAAVPGFILLGFYSFDALISKFKPTFYRVAIVILPLYLALFFVRADRLMANVAEEKGTFAELKLIAAQLPKDNTVLAWGIVNGWAEWMNPLLAAFECRVAPIKLDSEKAPLALRTWVLTQKKLGKPSLLLADAEPSLAGFEFTKIKTFTLSRSALEVTTQPLPKGVWKREQKFSLYEITEKTEGARKNLH